MKNSFRTAAGQLKAQSPGFFGEHAGIRPVHFLPEFQTESAEHGAGVKVRNAKFRSNAPGQRCFANAGRAVESDDKRLISHQRPPPRISRVAFRKILFSSGLPTLTRIFCGIS